MSSALVLRVDARVLDPVALAEIELFTEVMIAASAADGPLAPAVLDRVLGLRRPVPAFSWA